MTERSDGQLVKADLAEPEMAYVAYQLRQAGNDWPTIADQVGYANAKTAEVCVRQYLQAAAMEMAQENRAEVLQLEMDRLDRLTNAYWETALRGEVKHAELVLKTIQTRARLLGLETLHEKVGGSTKTIVIAQNSEQYVAALKEIAEESS